MRITRDIVLKLAKDSAARIVRQNKNLVCIYLTGSALLDEYLLGGTTDIDLIVIHNDDPTMKREVLPLLEDVHLDIAHLSDKVFEQPRQLRSDPWLGSFMCLNPIALHDTHHWFEFTQASIAAQFDRPEYVIQRARPLADEARQIWMDLYNRQYEPGIEKIAAYIKALERAGNAVASLSGPPLTERRFWPGIYRVAQNIHTPELSAGLVDLFTTDKLNSESVENWFPAWSKAILSASILPDCPPSLADCRRSYYERAVKALAPDYPEGAAWILLRTFTRAVSLPDSSSPCVEDWLKLSRDLALDEDHFPDRLKKMDAYLDLVEETLESWSTRSGIK